MIQTNRTICSASFANIFHDLVKFRKTNESAHIRVVAMPVTKSRYVCHVQSNYRSL